VISYHISLKAQKPVLKPYPQELKTLGDHLRKRRLDLKLSQVEVASRLGVHACTVTYWENNRTTPDVAYLPGIAKFLGSPPWTTACRTLPERIVRQRERLGLSQKRLAHKLGMSPDTIADWEAGLTRPSPWPLRVLAAFFAHGGRPATTGRPPKSDGLPLAQVQRQALARHLKARRRELGLSQAQAAEQMGVTLWQIRGWEYTKHTPKPPYLSKITRFLGHVPEEINMSKVRGVEVLSHGRIL